MSAAKKEISLTERLRSAGGAVLRAYSYLIWGAICLFIGAALGVIGVRWADRAPIDWPVTATAVKDLLTALGILGAGLWAAFLAERRRSLSNRAQLLHKYELWKRGEDEILRVYVQLRNIGDVQITPGRAGTYVQTPPEGPILADGDAEDNWIDVIQVRHAMQEEEVYLEPGENEDYSFDFQIPSGCKLLQLHTYVECERRPNNTKDQPSAGKRKHETDYNHWDLTTLIDLHRATAGRDKTTQFPVPRRKFQGLRFRNDRGRR